MSAEEKVVRPNTGNRLRPRGKTVRQRFVETDVTPEEHKQILDYCLEHKISVSEFLADLILQDAAGATSRKGTVRFSVDFELSVDDYDKLELLVHLHKKEDLGELIRALIQPSLDLQRIHVPTQTKSLRFYLSDKEHETVTRHVAKRGTTAKKYVSFLAIRAIRNNRKRSK